MTKCKEIGKFILFGYSYEKKLRAQTDLWQEKNEKKRIENLQNLLNF